MRLLGYDHRNVRNAESSASECIRLLERLATYDNKTSFPISDSPPAIPMPVLLDDNNNVVMIDPLSPSGFADYPPPDPYDPKPSPECPYFVPVESLQEAQEDSISDTMLDTIEVITESADLPFGPSVIELMSATIAMMGPVPGAIAKVAMTTGAQHALAAVPDPRSIVDMLSNACSTLGYAPKISERPEPVADTSSAFDRYISQGWEQLSTLSNFADHPKGSVKT